MSIEIGPASHEPKSPNKAGGNLNKGKSAGKDASSGGASIGFIAVMGCMDDLSVSEPINPTDEQTTDFPASAAPADITDLLLTMDLLGNSARFGETSKAKMNIPDVASPSHITDFLSSRNPDADFGLLPSNSTEVADDEIASFLSVIPVDISMVLQMGEPEPKVATQVSVRLLGRALKIDSMTDISSEMASTSHAKPNTPRDSSITAAVSVVANDAVKRDLKSLQFEQQLYLKQSVDEKPDLVRVIAVDRERWPLANANFRGAKADEPLGFVAQSITLTGSVASPIAEGVVTVEQVVAQHVSYLISKDVQSAEMKLDIMDGSSLEVSITMQGNEAHIAFRADEVQTREMLENAGSQLKEMLKQEGVALTGVSVGTSDSRSSGDQERKFRQNTRQSIAANIAIAAVVSEKSIRNLSGVGRSLDVFV